MSERRAMRSTASTETSWNWPPALWTGRPVSASSCAASVCSSLTPSPTAKDEPTTIAAGGWVRPPEAGGSRSGAAPGRRGPEAPAPAAAVVRNP
jgi:hypothetical protein